MSAEIVFALSLTLLAGLATSLGSLVALFTDRTKPELLGPILGFSAGVMLYVSFIEIVPKGLQELESVYGASRGYQLCTALFFVGVAIAAILDRIIPVGDGNPHEPPMAADLLSLSDRAAPMVGTHSSPHLLRMGIFIAAAISLHNFPEGFATFAAALQDPTLGATIAFAIAVHNIPEGIAVAVPVFYATGKKRPALMLALLSGLAEPVGAFLCYVTLSHWITDPALLLGLSFPVIAGIMVFVSLDELLPSAERYGGHHPTIYGLFTGMLVMALSLVLARLA